jgi:hypothetical protein
VRVVRASDLMREAAEVLAPVRDDVVVIGAIAVQVALDGHSVALMPTRDVDAAVKTEAVERVVAQLRAAQLQPSPLVHERDFTWVKGDLKVQLLRPFHPFPKGAAKGLPVSNLIPELDRFRELVAFEDSPETPRFWVATAAALVGLKEAAFGRTRHDGERVDRDFSDVALLLDRRGEEIAAEVRDTPAMLACVRTAAERLIADEGASAAAARELEKTGEYDTERAAEIAVRRAAERFRRLLP